jgi:endoglucanase
VAPYTPYVEQTFSVQTSTVAFTATFTMPIDDLSAGLVFFAGSGLMSPPVIVCIDNVELVGRGGSIAVNQVGYLPGRPKHATVAASATVPFGWELIDAGGVVVASGQSIVLGDDSPSGEHVHDVDFTSFDTPGDGYRIRVGADESAPFSVGDGVIAPLFRDALSYFYHSRSGTPIEIGRDRRVTSPTRTRRVRSTPAAAIRWTYRVAGTTPETTASTRSRAASRSGRC